MSKTEKEVYWEGAEPLGCELCEDDIKHEFIDGRTRWHCWGMLCPVCHTNCGVGLGLGKGQRYVKQPDGKWLKVEG